MIMDFSSKNWTNYSRIYWYIFSNTKCLASNHIETSPTIFQTWAVSRVLRWSERRVLMVTGRWWQPSTWLASRCGMWPPMTSVKVKSTCSSSEVWHLLGASAMQMSLAQLKVGQTTEFLTIIKVYQNCLTGLYWCKQMNKILEDIMNENWHLLFIENTMCLSLTAMVKQCLQSQSPLDL